VKDKSKREMNNLEPLYDGMGNSKTAYVQNIINDLQKRINELEKENEQLKKENKVKKNANSK
jgi:hypothetical protein